MNVDKNTWGAWNDASMGSGVAMVISPCFTNDEGGSSASGWGNVFAHEKNLSSIHLCFPRGRQRPRGELPKNEKTRPTLRFLLHCLFLNPDLMTARLPLTPRRLRLFKAIALAMPLLLLAVLEGLLRLSGYGQHYRLFVTDDKHPDYWVMSRNASSRYFTEGANATIGNQERFRKKKDANTFRVFVLGESTTIGFPYLHNGSFHRWLQYRLLHTFPEKNFEIINLSLTAVNSYTVLGFAREIVDHQPDAVLIYTGHNEYYGAPGVGSASYLGGNPQLVRLGLGLRELRVVQLANGVKARAGRLLKGREAAPRETLMERMAAEGQIPFGSDLYTRGIRQFESNLDDALRLLDDQGIPVLVSNLVSNEKDLKPFSSDDGRPALSAAHAYARGEKALAQGRDDQARQHYRRARELDRLRFRAPAAMNEIIRKLAAQYPNVHLVDSEALFRSHSPHGILGRETLLEHVHPNLAGYALLSEAFYGAMRTRKMIAAEWPESMSLSQLRRQMPITRVDSLKGAYEILMLREGWPFNEPIAAGYRRGNTPEEKLAGALAVKQLPWGEAMQQLLNHYLRGKNTAEALKVAEALLLEYPYDPAHCRQAGKLAMNLEDNERAVVYLKKAFALSPNFDTARSLFVTLLKMDQPEAALPYLNYAVAGNGVSISLNRLTSFVAQIIDLKRQYAAEPGNAELANQIAATYLQFANTAAAAKYVERSLLLAQNNPNALQLQAQIREIQN